MGVASLFYLGKPEKTSLMRWQWKRAWKAGNEGIIPVVDVWGRSGLC